MIAAWRRGGGIDTVFVPVFMALGAFPAYFTGLLVVYFLGLKLGWFPIQHAYDNGATPGANWHFISSAFRHGVLPALVIVLAYAGGWVLNMRTVMINTISEDYVSMAHAKGLRDRRVMTRYAARNAILPPLNGFAAQFATAVGGVIFIELVFSYPGCRLHASAGGARQRLPADAGAPARLRALPDRRELHHGPAQPRPRSAREDGLMAQMQPMLELPAATPFVRSRRKRRPGLARAPARQSEGARRARHRPRDGAARPARAAARSRRARRPSSRSSTRGSIRRSITCSARPTRAPTSSRRSRGARGARS